MPCGDDGDGDGGDGGDGDDIIAVISTGPEYGWWER